MITRMKINDRPCFGAIGFVPGAINVKARTGVR
jgi:hypothetical protein